MARKERRKTKGVLSVMMTSPKAIVLLAITNLSEAISQEI